MKTDWGRVIAEIDSLVRTGNTIRAKQILRNFTKPPREFLSQVASLCRRVGYPTYTLRLLGPIVRSTRKKLYIPTPEELAEYAAGLALVGAWDEALELLKKVEASEFPQVYLYQAFALVPQWEYAATIPLLKAYLSHREPSAYQKQIAEVNLMAALVVERKHAEAESLGKRLEKELMKERNYRLLASVLDFLSQNAILLSDWKQARQHLEKAETLELSPFERLFIKKWNAVVEAHLSGKKRGQFVLVRKEALALRHWETLRSCDLYEAKLLQDESLLNHVYFGTPSTAFRERLVRDVGFAPQTPENYLWKIGGDEPTLDVWRGEYGGKLLKTGQTQYRLVSVLSSDFYRPFRVAQIHSGIYPGEYFNATSSPLRVHQVIHRLRTWFIQTKIPLGISEIKSEYRLTAQRAISIRVPKPLVRADALDIFVQQLGNAFRSKPFTSDDARRIAACSLRRALYLLKEAEGRGVIRREGRAKRTVYRLTPTPKSSEPSA